METIDGKKAKDLTGCRFGRLTVIGRAPSKRFNCGQIQVQFLCRCDCGNELSVSAGNLKSGNTKSCGCLRRDTMSELGKTQLVHGMSKSRLHRIWHGMKQRCGNPSFPRFKDYGGRGITVCKEWQSSFEAFATWALANGYSDDLSIDRKDNDKGYSPDNCRWTTAKEQANNRRNKRWGK